MPSLITCKLNENFWAYIIWLIYRVFKKYVIIDVDLLIKNTDHKELDDIINIAFWTVYKSILLRNYKEVDNRPLSLKFLFASELRKRLEINKKCTGKPLYRLPYVLFNYV